MITLGPTAHSQGLILAIIVPLFILVMVVGMIVVTALSPLAIGIITAGLFGL